MPIPEKFKSWFEELCNECQLPDVATVCEESALAIGEILFVFREGGVGSEGKLLIQAVLDRLPQQGAAETMRRMLEIQLMTAGLGGSVFGLEPKTDAILLLTVVDPEQLPPKEAAGLLQLLAKAAFLWREILKHNGPVILNGSQKKLIQALKK